MTGRIKELNKYRNIGLLEDVISGSLFYFRLEGDYEVGQIVDYDVTYYHDGNYLIQQKMTIGASKRCKSVRNVTKN